MRTKELTRIAFGSVAGALLGAVAFLGIEGAAPRAADAQVYGMDVVSFHPHKTHKRVEIVGFMADKRVQVVGRCTGTGSTKIEFVMLMADEKWEIVNLMPDMKVCLSGDIEAFHKARLNPG